MPTLALQLPCAALAMRYGGHSGHELQWPVAMRYGGHALQQPMPLPGVLGFVPFPEAKMPLARARAERGVPSPSLWPTRTGCRARPTAQRWRCHPCLTGMWLGLSPPDVIPDPSILEEALRALRRVDDFAS